MATVTAKLNLNAAGFTAGLTRAQAALGRLKAIGVPALAAGFAAASAASVALAAGIKQAVDIGGKLSDLSARTGIAAGELRILGEAFDRAGIGAEAIGPLINKMQRALVAAGDGSATAQASLAKLGLTAEQLQKLSPEEQFQTLGRAIAGINDPAQQAAIAMELFGRAGGSLLALFKDSGAMADAARSIGGQADLLTRNAAMFDRASDILSTVGKKLEGFFIGVADQIVPALLPILEAADGLDFSQWGQSLGEAIGFALTAITSGQIGDLLGTMMLLAAANFTNDLMTGLRGIMAFFARGMQDIPANFVAMIREGLPAAAMKFAAILNRVIASLLEAIAKIPGLGSAADAAGGLRDAADSFDAKAEVPAANFAEQIQKSFAAALEAAAEAVASSGETIDTGNLTQTRDDIIADIVQQQMAAVAAAREKWGASKPFTPDGDFAGASAGRSNTGVIAQSLQKVGGGAAFARFSDTANPAAQAVREQQKTNSLLTQIRDRFSVKANPILL